MLKEIPQFYDHFGYIMQTNIAAELLRIKYLYEMYPEDLLQYFTISFPDFVNRIPISMIYSYMGISFDDKELIS